MGEQKAFLVAPKVPALLWHNMSELTFPCLEKDYFVLGNSCFGKLSSRAYILE